MCGGEIYFDKLLVFMWLIVLFYVMIGSLKVVFLLLLVFVGMVMIGLVYDFGCCFWFVNIGFIVGLLLFFIV